MRRPGGSWPRCTSEIREAIRPGVTTARARPDRPRRDRATGRPVELPRLRAPAVPGGDLRLAQRRDRPRHPRHVPARGGRHHLDRLRRDRRRLARRRRLHVPVSARSSPEAAAADRGHRGVPRRRHRRRWSTAAALGDIGHAVQARGRGGRVLGGAGVRGPRHRHGHARAARRAELRASRARAEAAVRADVFAVEPMVNVGAPRPGCSTTAGRSSPPTARCRPTSSTPSPSPTTAPRSSPCP